MSFTRCFFALAAGLLSLSSLQAQAEQPLQSRNPSYVIETARAPSQIRADYPYDIALRTVTGDTLQSDLVLPAPGKPTILLFWLTTCYPCRMELEALQRVWADWQKEVDFHLVAISTDFAKNYPAVEQRVQEQQWPWPAYIDLNREFSKILPGGLNGLPQTFFLNAEGQIVAHKRKFRPGDEAEMLDLLKQAAGL